MIFLKNYFVNTSKEIDVITITSDVRLAIREAGADEGLVTVAVPMSGAALIIAEPLTEVVSELKEAFKIFPGEGKEAMTRRKETVPIGPSIKAALVGRSIVIPFNTSGLIMGPRDEILLVDFEASGRRREYVVQVMGEGGEEQGQRIALGALGAEGM